MCTQSTRAISYAYDGLQRLTAASESPGASYAYAYDDAGNRSGVWVGGTRTLTQTFNAANQVDDSSATYSYDALNRMEPRGQASGKVALA